MRLEQATAAANTPGEMTCGASDETLATFLFGKCTPISFVVIVECYLCRRKPSFSTAINKQTPLVLSFIAFVCLFVFACISFPSPSPSPHPHLHLTLTFTSPSPHLHSVPYLLCVKQWLSILTWTRQRLRLPMPLAARTSSSPCGTTWTTTATALCLLQRSTSGS